MCRGSLSIFHSYCIESCCMGKNNFFPLQLKPFLITQCNCMSIGSCSTKKQTNGSAAARKPMAVAAASQIISLQRRRPFSTDSSLMPRSAVEAPQQLDWTSCSNQLADLVILCRYPVRSKEALLKEQISAHRVRSAGLNACSASFSVLPLCARGRAFFSESDSAPRALLLSSLRI